MFQGIRELKAAKGRTVLIIATIMLITVLVTFLSSLSAGLSYQSVSALQQRLGDNQALVLEDTGSATLSASRLTPEQIQAVEAAGGETIFVARTRLGSTPVSLMSDAQVPEGTAIMPDTLSPSPMDLATTLPDVRETRTEKATFLDHMPVIRVNPSLVAQVPGATSGGIVDESRTSDATSVPGTKALTGSERWNASASYAGEQTSLNLMINLLYVIAALVVGAFFMVWTLLRLRGVTISTALGAARKVLIADSLGQSLIVLAIGIGLGVLLTWSAASAIGGAIPIVLSASTLALPALIVGLAGLLGAALSLKPVLSVVPRTALANV